MVASPVTFDSVANDVAEDCCAPLAIMPVTALPVSFVVEIVIRFG